MIRWLLVLIVGVVLGGAVAEARPGGGHSYSSGSSRSSSSSSYRSSSSNSSDGSGDATMSIPQAIGIVIGTTVVLLVIAIAIEQSKKPTWTSAVPRPAVSAMKIAPLRDADPGFSIPVFEDFAFQLYAAAHRAQGDPARLAALAPYLSQHLRNELASSPPIAHVVIGSLVVTHVKTPQMAAIEMGGVPGDSFELTVRIEANLAALGGTTNVVDEWTFMRRTDVQTRPRDRTRMFACPSCGAPFMATSVPGTCASCGQDIAVGRFDWTATQSRSIASTSVGLTLTGTVEEVGTNLPTIVDEHAYPNQASLLAADPNATPAAVMARTKLIYERLNAAWNAQDLRPVRGLVSASLLGYLQFWIDEYKRQHVANKLDDARITYIALAKVTRDAHYDAITLRVYADGLDYTLDSRGSVVGGSRTARRAYSEYWTLLRAAGRSGPVLAEPNCPNCGAPLAISDAGACDHCHAVVEAGAFDFVLSKIEQDEVYRG